MSTLSNQIEQFFAEIGASLVTLSLYRQLGGNPKGAESGIKRSVELSRVSKEGFEEGCRAFLRIVENDVLIVVSVWTKEKSAPHIERGQDTIFPLSTPTDVISGFMISRFRDLP